MSKGAATAAILLLVAVAIGRPAPREHVAVAQTTAVVLRHDPVPVAISDHVLLRQLAIARATASLTLAVTSGRRVKLTAARAAAPHAAGPAHASSGAGEWVLINRDRAGAGLASLQWSDCLARVALGQAQRMAAQGYISHAGGRILDLGCHLGTQTGENIGFQGGGVDDAAMNAWFMGDAPHRANILGPYHDVGAAWVIAANGTAYLAVEFG